MGRVFRGAAIRTLFCACIALITILVVVLYEGKLTGSGSWACSMGIALLIIEGVVTKHMTQGFDWKWINPASIIFSGNCLAAIWFLQLRTLSFHSQGLVACINTSAATELTKIDLSLASDWLNFCACGHCNGAAEQFFVTILLVGRYFLPRGARFYHPENDKINLFLKSIARTHFFLVIACNGADALDLLSYTRFPTVQGNGQLVSMLLILFSVSIGQFCIDTLCTAEKKVSDVHIIVETDLWASLLILLLNDVPFLAMRLFVMTNYQVFSSMGVFFFFKNFVSICVTLHKGVMIWLGKDEEEIEEYVASQPWSPEPADRDSIMDTPDSLDSISQAGSIYSHENVVKSRVEKQPPKNEWGNEDTWFGESQPEFAKKNTTLSSGGSQISVSQDWDVEAGVADINKNSLAGQQLDIWNPGADPAYFTEGYALECDSLVEVSKIGHRRFINAPLGPALMRGQIDYSRALPKPEPRQVDSPQSDRKEKKKREKTQDVVEEPSEEKEKPKSQPDKLENDIEDILSAVDEEPKKEKKKKKKKDREKDKEKHEVEAEDEKREEKKHKKKKSKSDEKDLEEEPERTEKHKKKKKNKDKDKDRD